jgi:aspartyl/glutamyl-tRNA(Asn/Gln) amidotransferase C subunit
MNEITRLEKLARFTLTEKEVEMIPKQLEEILAYVGRLQNVDTSTVPAFVYQTDAVNVWREDIEESCTEEVRQRSLRAFPKSLGGALEVQGVFESRTE